MIEQKVYLLLENLDQLNNPTFGFVVLLMLLIDIYSSYILKLYINIMYIKIYNVPAPVEFVMTQCDDPFRVRLISQLIKGYFKSSPKIT